MWSLHEELVVWQPVVKQSSWTEFAGGYGRNFAMLGAALSFAIAAVRSLGQLPKSPSSDKHFV
jgi:hypothetical protein